jgi:hypothetical protein
MCEQILLLSVDNIDRIWRLIYFSQPRQKLLFLLFFSITHNVVRGASLTILNAALKSVHSTRGLKNTRLSIVVGPGEIGRLTVGQTNNVHFLRRLCRFVCET